MSNAPFTAELLPTVLDSKADPIIYHYCSADAFLSIAKNRKIWLSDINTMNDFSENHWAYDQFIIAANLVKEEVGTDFLDIVDEVVSSIQAHALPLIFCASKDGDVLSQWRAYADDGRGVAVGFDTAGLQNLSVTSASVVYDTDDQVTYFAAAIMALKEMYEELPLESRKKDLFADLFRFGIDLAKFKNPAFQEEREARLIRVINVDITPSGPVFCDSGGVGSDEVANKVHPLSFRSRQGGIVTYMELSFAGLGSHAIREIVIGPKSPNSGAEVAAFMNQAGFEGFKIRKSRATYR